MPTPTMRAMVLREWGGPLALEERPVPEPGPGEVRVRVVGCGAGLTLQHIRDGLLGGSLPRVLGHELGGLVDACGPGVTAWRPGDRVTATFNLICGACRWCSSGRETLCEHHGGFIGAATDGGFADHVIVPQRNLVTVPDGVPLRLAGIVGDAVATPYHAALVRARVGPGDRVAVIGAGGGVGIHAVDVVRAFGAEVLAVERQPAKVARLLEHPGVAVVEAGADLRGGDLADAAGGPLDVVLDLVCTPETVRTGVEALGRGGTVVLLGPTPRDVPGIQPLDFINLEKAVVGSRNVTRTEIARCLALVADGRLQVHVGASHALEDVEAAFAEIAANEVFGRVVVDVTPEHA